MSERTSQLRNKINGSLSHEEFMVQVIQLLDLYHWRYYHTYRSTRSPVGFPDIAAVRGNSDGRSALVFLEIKTQKGKLTVAQLEWLSILDNVPGVVATVCRPSWWNSLVALLR